MYAVRTGVRSFYLVEQQPLGYLASQKFFALVPGVTDIAGFDLKYDDKLCFLTHHTCRWLGLYGDHRQHGTTNLKLPTQNHIACGTVEPVNRHTVHLTLDRVEPNLARQISTRVCIRRASLQFPQCPTSIDCQCCIEGASPSFEGCDTTARRLPIHPHRSRGGTPPVLWLIYFRRRSNTSSSILPAYLI